MLYYILFKKHRQTTVLDDVIYSYRLDFKIPRKGWMDEEDEEYSCLFFTVYNTSKVNHLLTSAMDFWFLCFHDHLRDHTLMDGQSLNQSILEWCQRSLERDSKTSTRTSFLKQHLGLILTVFFHLESLLMLNTKLVEHKMGRVSHYIQPPKTCLKTNLTSSFQPTPPHSPTMKTWDTFLSENLYKNPTTPRNNPDCIVASACQSFLLPWIGDYCEVITCNKSTQCELETSRSQEELLYILLYYIKASHLRPYHISFQKKTMQHQ